MLLQGGTWVRKKILFRSLTLLLTPSLGHEAIVPESMKHEHTENFSPSDVETCVTIALDHDLGQSRNQWGANRGDDHVYSPVPSSDVAEAASDEGVRLVAGPQWRRHVEE